MIDISNIKYPELERIANLKPNPEILLGQEIYWTVKRDGCLHGNVDLFTDKGSLSIKEIVEKTENGEQINVLTYNFDENITEYSPVLGTLKRPHTHEFVQILINYIKGSKPIGKIGKDGKPKKFPLVVTENHLFYTKRGWIQASDLKEGDIVYIIMDKIPYIQEQVIIGTILGDGSVYTSSAGNKGFSFSHGIQQNEYLDFKIELLKGLCKKDNYIHNGGYSGSKEVLRGISTVNTHINELLKKYTLDGSKRNVEEIMKNITPISLAIWYCDDGSLVNNKKQRPVATFSIYRYSDDERKIIQKYLLQKLGLISYIENNGVLKLSVDSSDAFFLMIAPYVHQSMQYKLPREYHSNHCYLSCNYIIQKTIAETKVVSIKKPSKYVQITSKTFEYDIQTINGNYFANGILVHNSNIGVYLDDEDNIQLRSRNLPIASDMFYSGFNQTSHVDAIRDMILNERDYGDEIVVFGEMLMKGRSPTRIEMHEDFDYVVFDIWSTKQNRFLHYNKVYQTCYHFDIPVVDLYGTCNVSTIESLYKFKDEMIAKAKDNSMEGVVGKVWAELPWNCGEGVGTKRGIVYFKEKHDLPSLEKLPRMDEAGKIQLPSLPDSEIYGAIEKVRTDIGNDFTDIKIAMPLVAQYINEECRKHNCCAPRNIFQYYQQRIRDIQTGVV